MAALMMVSAAGCKKGSENRLEVSGLYVKTDLSIVGTFVEPFEKSYYNETELRLMVEDEIKSTMRGKYLHFLRTALTLCPSCRHTP